MNRRGPSRINRYDRLEDIFHLTPSGWVHTRSIERGVFLKDERPPADRVETWRRLRVASSERRTVTTVQWECIWANEEVPLVEREGLRGQFGFPEASLS